MLNIIKYPVSVQISNSIINVISLFHFSFESGIFFCKSSGDEWVWKPVFYILISWHTNMHCPSPWEGHILKEKAGISTQNKWLLYLSAWKRVIPLLSLWFLKGRGLVLFCFSLEAYSSFAKCFSTYFSCHTRMPRPGYVRLNASLHAWLWKQLIKKSLKHRWAYHIHKTERMPGYWSTLRCTC